MKIAKNKNTTDQSKRKRGRPKKIKTPEELAKEAEKAKRPKLTKEERLNLKLKRQKERIESKKNRSEDEFYCSNAELLEEMIKWRDSAEDPENRIMSDKLGNLIIKIGNKLLNHSNFRHYDRELKNDMLSFYYLKVMKGLKNYNFNFKNVFGYISQIGFNACITVLNQHYKHLNIKYELSKNLLEELEKHTGVTNTSSLAKYINNYINNINLNRDGETPTNELTDNDV